MHATDGVERGEGVKGGGEKRERLTSELSDTLNKGNLLTCVDLVLLTSN